MIITYVYAMRLVRAGKASIVATCINNDDKYWIINRHDLQRTDHALIPHNK